MMKVTLLLIILNFNFCFSQTTQEWIRTYNGPENYIDFSNDIASDLQGNIYVTGVSNNFYATIKYNKAGQELWVKRDTIREGGAKCIVVDDSGNVYVTGYRQQISTFNRDVVTIKYNTDGVKQWQQSFNVPNSLYNYPEDMCIDNFRNIYITGFAVDSSYRKYITIKYNSSGAEIWSNTYGNSLPGTLSEAYSIEVSATGNVYVTGTSGTSAAAMTTLKYDEAGNLSWARNFSKSDSYTVSYKVATDNSENVYICGITTVINTSETYFTTVKYNSSGDQLWVNQYFNDQSNYASASTLVADNSDNVYVTGHIRIPPVSANYLTIKYNSSGDQVWVQKYQGPEIDSYLIATDIAADNQSNIYITGYENYRPGIFTVKYNSSGGKLWHIAKNQTIFSRTDKLLLDSDNNVYLTGRIYMTGQNYNFYTTKYSQSVGINSYWNTTSSSFYLGQNYPNPFNPNTVIRYSLSENCFVNLKVYDMLGNEIATLVNEKQNRGSYSHQFSSVDYQLSSGIYFYKLETENYSETKRMILLK